MRDVALVDLADRQHGIVAYRQLRALGYSPDMIQTRIERHLLHPLHKGVYAVGHRVLTGRARWMAATLAFGPSAVLSHRSAGALHDLRRTSATLIDVTVPGTSRKRRPGVRLHRTRVLHPEERTVVDGIPTTSVARTIVDLASILSADRLLYAIEQAVRLQVFDLAGICRIVDRAPTRAGVRRLHQVLAGYRDPAETRSGFERRFLRWLARTGLPLPLVNQIVCGELVDLYWPQYGLVVELDGRPYHDTPRAFETDRLRDAKLQRAGLRVLRVTEKRFDADRAAVEADIVALIALAA